MNGGVHKNLCCEPCCLLTNKGDVISNFTHDTKLSGGFDCEESGLWLQWYLGNVGKKMADWF